MERCRCEDPRRKTSTLSTYNQRQLGPQFGTHERPLQTYEAIVAENAKRSGPLQSEEKLAADPRIAGGMTTGFSDGRERPRQFEAKLADGRGAARYIEAPTWAAVDGATRQAMADGTSSSGQQRFESLITPSNGGRRPNIADVTSL